MGEYTIKGNVIKVLDGKVLVRKEKRFESSQKLGNLYLPDQSMLSVRETKIGRVLAIGDGVLNKYGDRIPILDLWLGRLCYYARYSGEKFEQDGEQYILLDEHAILATIVGEVPEGRVSPLLQAIFPRHDRMIVKPKYSIEYAMKSGLIVFHDKTKEVVSVLDFEVIKVGPGRMLKYARCVLDMTVRSGAIVHANLLSGAVFTLWQDGLDKQEYRLLSERDVLGYVKKEDREKAKKEGGK